jgi:two-component system sensor histidine kinase QseC
MKLFTRYNRVNIAATILTFLIGSIAFYFVMDYVLTRQLDLGLRVEQQEIMNYSKKNNALPEIHNTKHQWIEITETNERLHDTEPYYTKTYNAIEKEHGDCQAIGFYGLYRR